MSAALPPPVAALADALAALPGVEAVVLGGSRATGTARPDSDWDLGLYYRCEQPLDPAAVRALGHPGVVSALGEWGPIVNGGAWLTVDGHAVDVLFRDYDRVRAWLGEAEHGRFEVLAQNGYLAGAPTYVPVGELAVCVPLHGRVLRPVFPAPLAATAPPRWEGRAGVALLFAQTHAARGDAAACAGMLALAVLCVAHARLAARAEWVLNEKDLAARAGLGAAGERLAALGDLPAAVADVGALLGVAPLRVR
jgi:predicted nucleotidyltransferase